MVSRFFMTDYVHNLTMNLDPKPIPGLNGSICKQIFQIYYEKMWR